MTFKEIYVIKMTTSAVYDLVENKLNSEDPMINQGTKFHPRTKTL